MTTTERMQATHHDSKGLKTSFETDPLPAGTWTRSLLIEEDQDYILHESTELPFSIKSAMGYFTGISRERVIVLIVHLVSAALNGHPRCDPHSRAREPRASGACRAGAGKAAKHQFVRCV